LAADSRSSFLSANKFRIATDYAKKVFEIGDRFAAVTSGWSTVEGKTIAGQIKDFTAQTTVSDDVNVAADELRDFIAPRIDAHIAAGLDPAPPAGIDVLTFIMGGFDGAGLGRLKFIGLPTGRVLDGFSTENPGVNWAGEVDVIVRTVFGYDAARLDVSRWAKRNREALSKVHYNIGFRWFALQDAIDFAAFVVRTTIDSQRFTDGTYGSPGASPTCGGPLQIASIALHEGVEWIQQTKLRGGFTLLRAEGALEE
jgi:hypothetical protein